MSKDHLKKYYETTEAYSPEGYRMEKNAETSRVRFLKEYIERYAKPGDKILDVGCGDMYLTKVLPQYDWTGIDISNKASAGRAKEVDLQSSPYDLPSGHYDMAICSEVLEHLLTYA